jgi:gluconolactonase
MEPGSNGLLFDPKGRLVLMQHGNRCVARLNDDGKTFTRLVEKVGDKRLNSPNDGAFKSNGDLYSRILPMVRCAKASRGFSR